MTGALIRTLRKEKNMTQQDLAKALCVTTQAVSKWERELGTPDITLLKSMAALFGTQMETLLSGTLDAKEMNGGNLKNLQFFVCPQCNGMAQVCGQASILCCGRTLNPLKAKQADAEHRLHLTKMDGAYYVTCQHAMEKSHYISFIASVAWDGVHLTKLYPQQDAAVHLAEIKNSTVFYYCTKHGLMKETF